MNRALLIAEKKALLDKLCRRQAAVDYIKAHPQAASFVDGLLEESEREWLGSLTAMKPESGMEVGYSARKAVYDFVRGLRLEWRDAEKSIKNMERRVEEINAELDRIEKLAAKQAY